MMNTSADRVRTQDSGEDLTAVIGSDDAGFRARHAVLARGHGAVGDPDDPAMVQAMQLILHLPKTDPPPRSALLAAAATAVVALCLDERVGQGGIWQEPYLAWTRSHIRKVARRARGSKWHASCAARGVTAEIAGAQARALVPGPVGAVDPLIKRLQVGGTDLDHDDPGPPDPELPVLWVHTALGMTLGKAAAQVGHASMLLAAALPVDHALRWSELGFRCSVREADARQWSALAGPVVAGAAVAVRDAGFTEVEPGSMTVIAVPPRSW
ncbi:peptidyl-tRNA hydrolase [Nocardia sp. 004]|uniref:peptidyl-tRNA hydrolase n=1 Tax=Nocardia sp. 004 TaxID=3385978 RepID=UPI00399F484B